MKIKEMAGNDKAKLAIACIAIGLALAVGIALASCSSIASVGGTDADRAVADVVGGVAEEVDFSEAKVAGETEAAPIGQETDGGQKDAEAKDASCNDSVDYGDAASLQGSTVDSQRRGATGGSSGNSAPSPQDTVQKTWVEETERVWVVDKEAWTESVPVYSTVEVSICNICGADITGNTSAHAKEHMKAGEGSGHHSEVRSEITGYNTVSHPEEGHWETRAVGGHWE